MKIWTAACAAFLLGGCASMPVQKWEVKAGVAGEGSARVVAYLANGTCVVDDLPEGDTRKSLWFYGVKEPRIVVNLHEDEPDDEAANAEFDRICGTAPRSS